MLGDLRFGELVNTDSHAAIVDPAVWQQVQRVTVPRGRRAKSERLLARLGVLRCATCGARMVVGTSNRSTYWLYRCPPTGNCQRRVTIAAELAETVIVEAVKSAIDGMRGTAGIAEGIEDAERDLDHAERDLDAAVAAFTGLEDVQSARQKLSELRERRDQARDRLAEPQVAVAPATAVGAGDWNELSLEARRALIVAVVDRAEVAPGKGADRITVHLRAE